MAKTPGTITRSTVRDCLLAGDIGGTKTSLALYTPDNGLTEPLAETTVTNGSAAGFAELVENFLRVQAIRPDTACFGVAGPVSNNRVKMTNLDWTLDGPALQKRFGLRSVTLVNDLIATAMELFTAILAAEAANLALKILATGGLYIGGGIPPRILPFLQGNRFIHSFAKAEYREMLAAMPVHIILEPKTALIGAAACGREWSAAERDTP